MSNDYILFYGHTKDKKYACFSNWYHSPFKKDGVIYQNTEQYMMYKKALLMGDDVIALKILRNGDPKECKSLGRNVKNWDENKWVANREQIMYDGCMAKFSDSENETIKQELLSTYPKKLVEASPYDKIWGIGLSVTDERAKNEKEWKGLNLLGKTLDKVRDDLLKH